MDWKEQYADRTLSLEEAAGKVAPDSTVLVGMGVGIPYALLNAVTVSGIGFTLYAASVSSPVKAYLPPYNRRIAVKNCFFGPVERASMKLRPNLFYQPMHLSDTGFDRSGAHRPDTVLIQAAPPDENGMLSQGPSPLPADAIPPEAQLIVQINDRVPYIRGDGCMIPASRADWFTEAAEPIFAMAASAPTELERSIAGNIVDRIDDGACIQLGIGSIGTAVGAFLKDKKHLGIHTEMFVESMADLLECGAADNSRKTLCPGKSVYGFAAGSVRLYEYLAADRNAETRPFSWVNDPRVISQNDNVVSVNSALGVDLTGQVCAESIGQSQYSGTGGQADYVRGARWSRGGKSFIAMPSTRTDKAGKMYSKITLTLPEGSAVTTLRSDVQYIVTEYGCVDLRGEALDVRAKKLISISHPDFRDELTAAAKKAGLIL
jgi:4-hydroxybutyrate CoA-transferase